MLGNNPIFRTLSFSDGCSRFFSRLWSVSRRKRLTLDDMGPNMGPPFGRRTAEKRLELKIYMGYTMAHEFGEHIPELLGHRVAHIRAVSQPFLSQHLRFIVPTSKYLFIVAFPDVWKLLVMATCQSQPFSTVSLIYGEPLGSRSHFKVRGWHGRVDCSFFEGCHDVFYEF